MNPSRRALPGTEVPWAWPAPWMRQWRREWLHGDLTAGLVVAVMLVPQSLAYAMLAGLPPQAGLLASLLPLLLYALVGSSSAMSVGPGAITSLMVAQALAPLARAGSADYIAMAGVMALGSAALMLLMGVLRMGFLSQLLSRPVVQGFTAASALLILFGQIAPLLGMGAWGATLPDMLHGAWLRLMAREPLHVGDALAGLGALIMLTLLGPLVRAVGRVFGASATTLAIQERLGPVWVLGLVAWLASQMSAWGMAPPALVGAVSLSGALSFNADITTLASQGAGLRALLMPTMLLALVGFVSSMSVAQTFALKHGERVDADRELLGLGLANLGSTLLGGMPVSGGLSRSAVNEAAGARSPLAGVISAALLAAMLLLLMPWLAWLPKAALAAVIIYAIAGLVEWQSLKAAWRYDRADAGAFISTAAGVLLIGFEAGLMLGLAWSLAAMVWRHSQPHMAEVGRLPGTAHYRNVARYEVDTLPDAVMVRVDESLDFTNIQRVELKLCELVHGRSGGQSTVNHVVLLLSAVNHIDHTAVQALIDLDKALADQGKTLHLAEVKGFVMDRLKAAGFDARFAGRHHLSAQEAWDALSSARVAAV
ncbi:MAG: SulP family inorganic anion transporter [Aquabacterium sp.]|uniref:SulP family inorganic anion transporter n=1 Tax=Aquabacterium sp. TaxID=1872578 RepID=UPI0025C29851|nr:SulP family inorganic anion transporter [Aquabacterium sp.]MBI5924131.1 SulP family inorganic anion transporter [Aquabacterium sp.]